MLRLIQKFTNSLEEYLVCWQWTQHVCISCSSSCQPLTTDQLQYHTCKCHHKMVHHIYFLLLQSIGNIFLFWLSLTCHIDNIINSGSSQTPYREGIRLHFLPLWCSGQLDLSWGEIIVTIISIYIISSSHQQNLDKYCITAPTLSWYLNDTYNIPIAIHIRTTAMTVSSCYQLR